jgi:hypothetical protein
MPPDNMTVVRRHMKADRLSSTWFSGSKTTTKVASEGKPGRKGMLKPKSRGSPLLRLMCFLSAVPTCQLVCIR